MCYLIAKNIDGENIEIPKENYPVQEEKGIYLGKDSILFPPKLCAGSH